MQIEIYEPVTQHDSGRTAILSSPLSNDERSIWKAWLPDSYQGKPGFRRYDGDPIPQEILVKLQVWNADDLMDTLELRINPTCTEAAVFGLQGSRCWLLARWKQGDGVLASYDDVLESVTNHVSRDASSFKFFAVLLFLMGILGFCGAISLLTSPEPDLAAGIGSFAVAGIALLGAIGAWHDRKDSLWRALYALSESARERI